MNNANNNAVNNEEYKKVIKTRINHMILFFAAGVIMLTFALLAKYVWDVSISKEMLGNYMYFGAGLVIISVILFIKNKLLLTDDIRLKNNRMAEMDERLQEINYRAFKAATVILIVALSVAGVIGGLFYPVLFNVLITLVCIFLIGYLTAYKIFEKRM